MEEKTNKQTNKKQWAAFNESICKFLCTQYKNGVSWGKTPLPPAKTKFLAWYQLNSFQCMYLWNSFQCMYLWVSIYLHHGHCTGIGPSRKSNGQITHRGTKEDCWGRVRMWTLTRENSERQDLAWIASQDICNLDSLRISVGTQKPPPVLKCQAQYLGWLQEPT